MHLIQNHIIRMLFSILLKKIILMIIAYIIKVPDSYYKEFNESLKTYDEFIIVTGL